MADQGSRPSQRSAPSGATPSQAANDRAARARQAMANGHNDDLEALRDILTAAERIRLNRIEARIDHPVLDPASVATVLPEAIRERSQQDRQLAGAMAPMIEETLLQAVQRSPKRIADALSPVIGPAIRKAIADALQTMVRSLNQTLEYSVSVKGLAWRWEAWRTGKTFGEIVLLHTLQYRVEHVFLIHRATGIRLAHATLGHLSGREDVIAAMFSAITTAVQRFATDSFGASSDSGLQSFAMDDELHVWIEQGDDALLAAVIRGIPPPDLRTTLQSTLAEIHVEYGSAFRNYRGDLRPFEPAVASLLPCLRQASRPEETLHAPGPFRLSPALLALLIVPLFVLAWWAWTAYVERTQWDTFVTRANREPGLHLTQIHREGSVSTVRGMRDPLAVEPMLLAVQSGLPTTGLQFELEPYLSLSPELVLRRAARLLHPPAEVTLSLEDDNGAPMLTAVGTAPHDWIVDFVRLGPTIPGVSGVKSGRVHDRELLRLQAIVAQLHARDFLFETGQTSLVPAAEADLTSLPMTLKEVDRLADILHRVVRLDVVGEASPEGAPSVNQRLAAQRSQRVYEPLARDLWPHLRLRAIDADTYWAQHPPTAGQAPPPPSPRVFLRAEIADIPSPMRAIR
ncbi:MAG: hypothetical protein U0172_13975 [Nitrospiraceae bacterium]